ncbi:malonyl-ACP O-methyltransferase BioC [Simiduia litorea]|uniref:malonyl-ACP O-methyltransferase BioC n=1 Tax=Simiduia litorea TaxID=1435348 RepID=UPI0036F3DA38
MTTSVERSKSAVAESFSRAAKSYDSAAQLQRDIGTDLFKLLPVNASPQTVVDIGSGTGFFTGKLKQVYPQAMVCGLDLAQGMLRYARSQHPASLAWLGADMESLPFAEASIQLFFSSLALQWSEDLPAFFTEIYRALAPGGLIALATLGPNTLFELRDSWRQVDGFTHVNQFAHAEEVRAAAGQAGLQEQRWVNGEKVMHYDALRDLTHELKAIGAHNVNRARAPGLTGREKLIKLRTSYEAYRQPAGLPATYEVYWMLLQRPE